MSRVDIGCTKKLIRSKSGLRIVSSDGNLQSPFYLGEPQWIPDKEIANCAECKIKFDFIKRKHHCRRCGRIYCGSCCDTKIGLPRMCFVDPVRVCGRCAILTNKEKDFFDRQLKILTNGATFMIDSPSADCSTSNVLSCKLSSDHRHLLFEGAMKEKPGPVELARIKFIGVGRDKESVEQMEDFEGVSSVEMEYSEDQLNRRLKLFCGPEPHRKLAHSWISAIHQAFKLLYEQPQDNP